LQGNTGKSEKMDEETKKRLEEKPFGLTKKNLTPFCEKNQKQGKSGTKKKK